MQTNRQICVVCKVTLRDKQTSVGRFNVFTTCSATIMLSGGIPFSSFQTGSTFQPAYREKEKKKKRISVRFLHVSML